MADELVFVVDDSPTAREMVSLHLRSMGCQPLAIATGAECLTALEATPPFAILLDFNMGEERGDDVCRAIKAHPAGAHVPVLMLTGTNAPHEIMYTWRAGADDFLPKPPKLSHLTAKIEALRKASLVEGIQIPRLPGDGRRLLFADDSRFYRRALGGALEATGFELIYAASGAEAWESLQQNAKEIDCLIFDVVMPGMDGVQLLEKVKGDPKFSRIPVLMLSGAPLEEHARTAATTLSGTALVDKREVPIEAMVSKVLTFTRRTNTELRAAERVPFFSVVEFREEGSTDWRSGFAYDVSRGGIFVRTLSGVPPGKRVELKFSMGVVMQVEGQGTVAWSNEFRRRTVFSYPVGMGVRFLDLPPAAQDALTHMLRNVPRQS